MPETVSCIVPTHSRPDFLAEALASVLAQSALPDEIVVVSDVDDPSSARLCAELTASSTVAVRYLRNPGRNGASSSRNHGAQNATGSVLAFLDDDDKWMPGYLEASLDVLAASGASAVATWIQMFRGDDVTPGLHVSAGLAAKQVAAENPGVTGSNLIVTAESFWRVDGFDEDLPVKNDGDFFFRYLLAGQSYAVNPQPLVLQRKHSSGQLTGRTEFRAAGLEKYLDKHRSVLTLADRRSIKLSAERIRYHAASGIVPKVRHLLLGAFYSSPRSVLSGVRNRRSKSFWLTSGLEAPASANVHQNRPADKNVTSSDS